MRIIKVKEQLLRLLENNPATAGRPSDFLDTLAEDIQALIIKAIVPPGPAALSAADEDRAHQINDIFSDHFGVKLSNLFTMEPFHGKRKLYYSARAKVVIAMIQAMLAEQDKQYDRNDSEQAGETIRQRLAEMRVPTALLN